MLKKINLLIFLLVAVLTFDAFADQTITLNANENTVNAAISKEEITRISFASDLESVHSLKGELEYEILGKDLYLRALTIKPINFFVKTQNGRTYKFITNPENIPATQIFVKYKATNKRPSCSKHNLIKEN